MSNKTQYRLSAEDIDKLFLEEMNWALARWPKRSTLEKLKGFNSAMKLAAYLGIVGKLASDSFNETIGRMEDEIDLLDELYSYLSIPISCLMEYKTYHSYIPSQVLLKIADYHVWDAWNDGVITEDERIKLSDCIDSIAKLDEQAKEDPKINAFTAFPESARPCFECKTIHDNSKDVDRLIKQFETMVESIEKSREREEIYRVDPSFLVNTGIADKKAAI